MPVRYGSLPFAEAIAYLRDKVDIPTARWDDISGQAHDRYFMVAGAAKADLLADLHAAVAKAIEQGATLATFREDFAQIVAARGWTGWTGEGTKAGEAWRTRVIYATNLRTSYAAGRYSQMKALADRRPYWRYRHNDSVAHPRPHHQAWDGTVLRHDDPWWDTHYTPNGWGCRCWIETLAERDLEREGITPDEAPESPIDPETGAPVGIDKEWDHAPGRLRDLQAELAAARRLPEPIAAALLLDLENGRTAPVAAILRPGAAYHAASDGGLHAGLLDRYRGVPSPMIERAIRSLERRCAEHEAKIADPDAVLRPDIHPKERLALIRRKWPGEIARFREQIEVLRGILWERANG